jgi:hypothetical protein
MIGAAVASSPSRSFGKRHAVTRLRLDGIAEVIFLRRRSFSVRFPRMRRKGVRASLVQG